MPRTLLFGAGGQPAVVTFDEQESRAVQMQALLIELYGLSVGCRTTMAKAARVGGPEAYYQALMDHTLKVLGKKTLEAALRIEIADAPDEGEENAEGDDGGPDETRTLDDLLSRRDKP